MIWHALWTLPLHVSLCMLESIRRTCCTSQSVSWAITALGREISSNSHARLSFESVCHFRFKVFASVRSTQAWALDMALVWQQEELSSECSITTLATSFGDPEFSTETEKLPIQLFEGSIVESIKANMVTGIKAETGSGKTMKGPEYLYDAVGRRPVVIVQKSCFAAASVYASLRDAFKWPHSRLHLLTGQHTDETEGYNTEFDDRYTLLSIITYGVLFKWLFS